MDPERTDEHNERLKAMQMADLGNMRREKISASDDTRHRANVRVDQIEARRASNIRGTQAQAQASRDKGFLEMWKNLHKTIDDVPSTDANLDSLMNGQSHRAALSASMEKTRAASNAPVHQARPPVYGRGIGKRPHDDEAIPRRPYPPAHPMNPFGAAPVDTGFRLDPALDINNGGVSTFGPGFTYRGSRGRGGRGKSGIGKSTGGPVLGPGPKPAKPPTKVSKVHSGKKPPVHPKFQTTLSSPQDFLADIRNHPIRAVSQAKISSSTTPSKEATQPTKPPSIEKGNAPPTIFQFSTAPGKEKKEPGVKSDAGPHPVIEFSAAPGAEETAARRSFESLAVPDTPTPPPRGTTTTKISPAVTGARMAMKSNVEATTEENDPATSLMTPGESSMTPAGKKLRIHRTITGGEILAATATPSFSPRIASEKIPFPQQPKDLEINEKPDSNIMSAVKAPTSTHTQPKATILNPLAASDTHKITAQAKEQAARAIAPLKKMTIQQSLQHDLQHGPGMAQPPGPIEETAKQRKQSIEEQSESLIDINEKDFVESSKVLSTSQGAAQLKGINFPTEAGGKPAPGKQPIDMSTESLPRNPMSLQELLNCFPTGAGVKPALEGRPSGTSTRPARSSTMSYQELLDYFPNDASRNAALEERLIGAPTQPPRSNPKTIQERRNYLPTDTHNEPGLDEQLIGVSTQPPQPDNAGLEELLELLQQQVEETKERIAQSMQESSVAAEEGSATPPRVEENSPPYKEAQAPKTPTMSERKEPPNSFSAYRSPIPDCSSDEKSTPSSRGTHREQFYDARDVTPSPEVSSVPKTVSEIQPGKRPMGSSQTVFRKASLFEVQPAKPEVSSAPEKPSEIQVEKQPISSSSQRALTKASVSQNQPTSQPSHPSTTYVRKNTVQKKAEIAKSIHAPKMLEEARPADRPAQVRLAEVRPEEVHPTEPDREKKRQLPKVIGPAPYVPKPKPKVTEDVDMVDEQHEAPKPVETRAETNVPASPFRFDARSPNVLPFNPDRPRRDIQQTDFARGHDAFQYSEMRSQIDVPSPRLHAATASFNNQTMPQDGRLRMDISARRPDERRSDERPFDPRRPDERRFDERRIDERPFDQRRPDERRFDERRHSVSRTDENEPPKKGVRVVGPQPYVPRKK